MTESADGDYVKHSDYAALEAERDRLRRELEEVANWCGRPLNIKCNECGPGHWPHCHELVMIARKVLEE